MATSGSPRSSVDCSVAVSGSRCACRGPVDPPSQPVSARKVQLMTRTNLTNSEATIATGRPSSRTRTRAPRARSAPCCSRPAAGRCRFPACILRGANRRCGGASFAAARLRTVVSQSVSRYPGHTATTRTCARTLAYSTQAIGPLSYRVISLRRNVPSCCVWRLGRERPSPCPQPLPRRPRDGCCWRAEAGRLTCWTTAR